MLGKKINDITPEEWDNIGKPTPFYPAKYDPVEKPEHYRRGKIECIDYIEQQTEEDSHFAYGYCYGNTMKYLHRFRYKDGTKDLRKARWYLDKMIKTLSADMEE